MEEKDTESKRDEDESIQSKNGPFKSIKSTHRITFLLSLELRRSEFLIVIEDT